MTPTEANVLKQIEREAEAALEVNSRFSSESIDTRYGRLWAALHEIGDLARAAPTAPEGVLDPLIAQSVAADELTRLSAFLAGEQVVANTLRAQVERLQTVLHTWLMQPADERSAQLQSELATLRASDAAKGRALERSVVALNDWLNVFASDFCDAERVADAVRRINESGTIGYITDVQEQNRQALAGPAGAQPDLICPRTAAVCYDPREICKPGYCRKQIQPPQPTESAVSVQTFQSRVQPWMMACFGAEISGDKTERNHRHLEESLELVQACGCTAGEAHQLVDYVYGRPAGDPSQEVGGVMVTLAALCLAHGFDMHAAGETELARIWTKVEQIRAKQAAKPRNSPLPAIDPAQERDHPMQPLVQIDGVIRFKENAIVRYLLNTGGSDMNRIAALSFSREDQEQFAQLIGYSVSGFGDLDYASESTIAEADRQAEAMIARQHPGAKP